MKNEENLKKIKKWHSHLGKERNCSKIGKKLRNKTLRNFTLFLIRRERVYYIFDFALTISEAYNRFTYALACPLSTNQDLYVFISFQNLKDQILTTNVWIEHVSLQKLIFSVCFYTSLTLNLCGFRPQIPKF